MKPVARSDRLDLLEEALGWRFTDRDLLQEALTHSSASSPARRDNERLEFLGDRVLGLMTAEALLSEFQFEQEGGLAPRFNALVRKESLAEVAANIELGAYLRLGRSESLTGGRRKSALLADALEAVIAAVYLDGGLPAARQVFERHWRQRLSAQNDAPIDAKTKLQEWAQARGIAPPRYELISRSGPDHAPSFEIQAVLSDGRGAQGAGGSKRAAEQAAAAALVLKVETAS